MHDSTRPDDRATNTTSRRRATRRAGAARDICVALAIIPLMALALAGCGEQQGAWRLISPGNVRMFSVAADPHIPELIYAGGDDGGVYRARADQTGVAVAGSGIPDPTVITSILPDPNVPGRIFAGTTAGLYRSEHYGDTWERYGTGLPSGAAALALAALPDDSALLAGIDGAGVYRSVDDGATWKVSSSGLPAKASVAALTWDPSDHLWWAGLQSATDHSLYQSADNGLTWQPADTLVRAGADINGLVTISYGPGVSDSVFAATSAGVYTNTGGGAWSRPKGPIATGAATAIAAIPGQAGGIVAAIGPAVYVSTNGGVSWGVLAQGLVNDVPGLAVASNGKGARVYYAASGQLARFPTGGKPASSQSTVLLITLIAAILVIGGYILTRRNRRFGYAMGANDNEGTAGPGAAAERMRRRRADSASAAGPFFPGGASSGRGQAAKRDGSRSSVLSPSDLTTRDRSGPPAPADKAARNGHSKRPR